MQRGTVTSFDLESGTGYINNAGENIVFNSVNVIGKAMLKQGDSVWYEMENRNFQTVAINVRKSM